MMMFGSREFAAGVACALAFVTSVAAQSTRPVVVQQPKSLYVGAGSTATFNTYINGAPFTTLVWHMTSPTEGPHIIPDGLGFDVHQMSLSVPSCIDNWSYNGWYWLSATNRLGGTITRRARMIVISAPQITYIVPDRTVRRGSTVILAVRANTDAAPWVQYRWYKNGNLVGSNRVLYLYRVQPANSGEYECWVTTLGGRAINSVNVTVQ